MSLFCGFQCHLADIRSFVQSAPPPFKRPSHAAALSILLSPGLLIIDHIHFQYNGFMYGLLILSLVLAREKSTRLASGLLFAALLCFKHIYLYLAPAYFVYLLRAYCLGHKSIFHIRFGNAVKLGTGIITIFGAAFGPFAYWGQIPQLLSRLFPFSRGLCHAYWAPNIWAIYSFTDRLLIFSVSRKLSPPTSSNKRHSCTSPQPPRESRSPYKRNPWSRRRYFLRRPPRSHGTNHFRSYPPIPNNTPHKTLLRSHMGNIHRLRHPLRLRILPLRVARPRESYPARHHSFLAHRAQGPSIPRRLPSFGCSRSRLALPSALHSCRVPYQDGLHDFLAGGLFISV